MSISQIFMRYPFAGHWPAYQHMFKKQTCKRETQHSRCFIRVSFAISNALKVLTIKARMKEERCLSFNRPKSMMFALSGKGYGPR